MECKERLLTSVTRRKIVYVGHVMRKQNMETDLLTGTVIGERGKGRPKTRYSDNFKDVGGRGMVGIYRMAQDRKSRRITTINIGHSVI